MNTSHPYDLVIGLDRSDRKADLHLIDTRAGQHRSATIDTAPEALWEWLLELRQQHPQARGWADCCAYTGCARSRDVSGSTRYGRAG